MLATLLALRKVQLGEKAMKLTGCNTPSPGRNRPGSGDGVFALG
jgi:hypothetical protein